MIGKISNSRVCPRRSSPSLMAVGRGLLLAWLSATLSQAELQPTLNLDLSAGRLTFDLVGDVGSDPWILQHSVDGKAWRDLVFLERDGGLSVPGVELDLKALPEGRTRSAMFRAVQLAAEDPFYREFLAARARWEAARLASYHYELRWNWSRLFWHGNLTVIDDEVASSEAISSFPEGIGPLDLLTIDGWFDKIADARAQGAEMIEVRWHPELGYPESGFIDVSLLIADEEQSWTIRSLALLR